MYFKLQKFRSQNLVNQAAVFCVRNALKVTYEHLRFEKFFRGLYPGPPLNRGGRTRGGKGREGRGGREGGRKEGKGMVPPHFNLVPHRFPWASYRPGRPEFSRPEPRLENSRDRDRHVKNVSRGVSSRDSSFEDYTSLGTTTDSITIINL
jgi:hypothetical protein